MDNGHHQAVSIWANSQTGALVWYSCLSWSKIQMKNGSSQYIYDSLRLQLLWTNNNLLVGGAETPRRYQLWANGSLGNWTWCCFFFRCTILEKNGFSQSYYDKSKLQSPRDIDIMLVGATEGPNRIFLWKISKIWPINGPGTPPMSMMNEKGSILLAANTQNKCLITKRH